MRQGIPRRMTSTGEVTRTHRGFAFSGNRQFEQRAAAPLLFCEVAGRAHNDQQQRQQATW